MSKKFGELTIYYKFLKATVYHGVTNFNLINGILYIWIYNCEVIKISADKICEFYYAYTPY